MLNFTEHALVIKCAQRAEADPNWTQARITTLMDLEVAHDNTPLDFAALLRFPECDFWHDMVGIANHMNRETGVLEGCFVPRCARPTVRSTLYVPRQEPRGLLENIQDECERTDFGRFC